MRPSVILTTYNQPAALEKVLWGYERQTYGDFQLVIADDGSGAETARLVAALQLRTGLDLLHVWHEDRAPCLHLHHERPYVDPARVHQNREARRLIRAERRVRERFGIAEMDRAGAPSHAGGQIAR